jgi:hypothetical protein
MLAFTIGASLAVSLAGLIGVYAWLVNEMAKGIERQRNDRLELEKRLRLKGIIE